MNVYKTIIEVIDGVEKEFVMIELNEYNSFMHLTNPLYQKIVAKEKKAIEKVHSCITTFLDLKKH